MDIAQVEGLGFIEYDTAADLQSPEEALLFLQAALEDAPADAQFIAHALGIVARAQSRMAQIAGESGLSRESLYKALSGDRDPAFSTILKVTNALGFRLVFARSPFNFVEKRESFKPQLASAAAVPSTGAIQESSRYSENRSRRVLPISTATNSSWLQTVSKESILRDVLPIQHMSHEVSLFHEIYGICGPENGRSVPHRVSRGASDVDSAMFTVKMSDENAHFVH